MNSYEKGYLDWQLLSILADLAVTYRITQMNESSLNKEKIEELRCSEETKEDIEIPYEVFKKENIEERKNFVAATAAMTWGLHINKQIPDLNAINKFMEARYNHYTDDIEHEYFWSDL